jgi:heat shock protein HslJ
MLLVAISAGYGLCYKLKPCRKSVVGDWFPFRVARADTVLDLVQLRNRPTSRFTQYHHQAAFDSGYIKGSAGCNRYSVSYQLSGKKIAVSPIASTRMYCATSDGVKTQEKTHL